MVKHETSSAKLFSYIFSRGKNFFSSEKFGREKKSDVRMRTKY